jgi:hypothetical protein
LLVALSSSDVGEALVPSTKALIVRGNVSELDGLGA